MMKRRSNRTAARLQHWGRLGVPRSGRCLRVRCTAFTYIALLLLGPPALHAQGFRGTATTTFRYVQLRPLAPDSVLRTQVTDSTGGTFFFDGHRVDCSQQLAYCRYRRPAERQDALALTQDVGVTAWGLGVPGLSATALLRVRADAGGDFTWPYADDRFDALLAYAQYNRGIWRGRLGRQQNLSGLGVYGYDGASVLVEPHARVSVEGYAGRSLGRGLLEPSSSALRGVADFPFDTIGRTNYLFGAALRYQPIVGTSATVRYQREIVGLRGALNSERASLDVSTDRLGFMRVEGALDWDVALNRMGKAHLRAQAPITRSLIVDASARRYRPFFELFTIWGFFSPVAYTETELRATYLPLPDLRLWASGAWRRYDETDAPIVFGGVEDETVRGAVGSDWLFLPQLGVQATYRFERGFGAFLSSGEGTLRWAPEERWAVFVDASAAQQIEEFRVGEAVVWGLGGGGELRLRPGMELAGGATFYRQNIDNRAPGADWNQRRAWLSLRLGFGEDPGTTRRPGRVR